MLLCSSNFESGKDSLHMNDKPPIYSSPSLSMFHSIPYIHTYWYTQWLLVFCLVFVRTIVNIQVFMGGQGETPRIFFFLGKRTPKIL